MLELKIGMGDAADYPRIGASVTAGDIGGRPFGESRGGFLGSFEKRGPGRYTLLARLWAGDLTLREPAINLGPLVRSPGCSSWRPPLDAVRGSPGSAHRAAPAGSR